MKLAVTVLSAALLFSSGGLALAQSKDSAPQGNKSDDCVPGAANSNDIAVQQSLRCRTEEKPGTVINNDNDVTGSTSPAPQRKHNMNDTVPESEAP